MGIQNRLRRTVRWVVYSMPGAARLGNGRQLSAQGWNEAMSEGGQFQSYLGGTVAHELRDSLTLSLMRRVRTTGTVLDVGCASGTLATRLAGYTRYRGVDISSVAIDRARKGSYPLPTEFFASALEDYNPPEPHDFIVMNEVLYLLNLDTAITQAVRYAQTLTPRGALVVSLKHDPKSVAILRGIRKSLKWVNGVLYQEQHAGPRYSVRVDSARPAYLIGMFTKH